ncbi:MAG: hypothetical protein AAF074_19345 [Pseudomonadota bacterium]
MSLLLMQGVARLPDRLARAGGILPGILLVALLMSPVFVLLFEPQSAPVLANARVVGGLGGGHGGGHGGGTPGAGGGTFSDAGVRPGHGVVWVAVADGRRLLARGAFASVLRPGERVCSRLETGRITGRLQVFLAAPRSCAGSALSRRSGPASR